MTFASKWDAVAPLPADALEISRDIAAGVQQFLDRKKCCGGPADPRVAYHALVFAGFMLVRRLMQERKDPSGPGNGHVRRTEPVIRQSITSVQEYLNGLEADADAPILGEEGAWWGEGRGDRSALSRNVVEIGILASDVVYSLCEGEDMDPALAPALVLLVAVEANVEWQAEGGGFETRDALFKAVLEQVRLYDEEFSDTKIPGLVTPSETPADALADAASGGRGE